MRVNDVCDLHLSKKGTAPLPPLNIAHACDGKDQVIRLRPASWFWHPVLGHLSLGFRKFLSGKKKWSWKRRCRLARAGQVVTGMRTLTASTSNKKQVESGRSHVETRVFTNSGSHGEQHAVERAVMLNDFISRRGYSLLPHDASGLCFRGFNFRTIMSSRSVLLAVMFFSYAPCLEVSKYNATSGVPFHQETARTRASLDRNVAVVVSQL